MFSPGSGERVRVRGRAPQYGKHRTRTAAARDFARQLRARSTDAEKRLWRLFRNHRFNQFKFRRQYPCGIYVLDFYCTVAKLAVELDGGGHGFPDQRARDEKRNRFLAEQGIKVLRFWNHQLRGELEAVRFEIWHSLMERRGARGRDRRLLAQACPLTPTLSPDGGEGVGAPNTRTPRRHAPHTRPVSSPPWGRPSERDAADQQRLTQDSISSPPSGERIKVRGRCLH